MTVDLQLKPSATYIVVFTRGRLDRQKTLRAFTPTMLKRTIVATIEPEIDELYDVHQSLGIEPLTYVGFDPGIWLNVKRYQMAKWVQHHGGSRFLMADDDLLLSAIVNGRYKTTKSEEGSLALDEYWRSLNGLWKDFDGIGLSALGRNNLNFLVPKKAHEKTGLHIQTNTNSALFYGFKTDVYIDMFAPFQRHRLLKSMAWTDLMSQFMLNATGEHVGCRVYDIGWTTSFNPKALAGGLSAHRTVKTNEKAVFIMKLFFPNVIASRQPTPGYFDNFSVDRQVYKPIGTWKRFDWKASYEEVQRSFAACEGSASGYRAVFPDSHKILRHYVDKLAEMASRDHVDLEESREVQQSWLKDIR